MKRQRRSSDRRTLPRFAFLTSFALRGAAAALRLLAAVLLGQGFL
jgi:hypothetical protein